MEARSTLDKDERIQSLVKAIKKSSHWRSGLDPIDLRSKLFSTLYNYLLNGSVDIESATKYLNMVFDPDGIHIDALFRVYRRAISSLSEMHYPSPFVSIDNIRNGIKKILDTNLKKIEEESEYHRELCKAIRHHEGYSYEKDLLAAIISYATIVRASTLSTGFFTRTSNKPAAALASIARSELELLSHSNNEFGYQACLYLASVATHYFETCKYYERILKNFREKPYQVLFEACSPEMIMSLGDYIKRTSTLDEAMEYYQIATIKFLSTREALGQDNISLVEHPSILKWIECIQAEFARKKNICNMLDRHLEIPFFLRAGLDETTDQNMPDEVIPIENAVTIPAIKAFSQTYPEAHIYLACYQCYRNTDRFKKLMKKLNHLSKDFWPEAVRKENVPIKLPANSHNEADSEIDHELKYLIQFTLYYYHEERKLWKNNHCTASPFQVLMRAIKEDVKFLDEFNSSVLAIYASSAQQCSDYALAQYSEKEKTATALSELKTSTLIATAIKERPPFVDVMNAFNIDFETNFENILFIVEALDELRELPGYEDNILAVKIRFKEKLEEAAQAQNIIAQYVLVRFKQLNPDQTPPHEYTEEDARSGYTYLEQISQPTRASVFTFRQIKDVDKEKVHRWVIERLKELTPFLKETL